MLLLAVGHASCNTCNHLDCVASNYNGQFRIVNSAGNKDLVFGPSGIYHKDSILFFSLNGADTVFHDTEAIRFSGAGYDSILWVHFSPGINNAFIQLNSGDMDTLSMTYHSYDTKCCGTITEISNFKLNQSTDLGSNSETRDIRK